MRHTLPGPDKRDAILHFVTEGIMGSTHDYDRWLGSPSCKAFGRPISRAASTTKGAFHMTVKTAKLSLYCLMLSVVSLLVGLPSAHAVDRPVVVQDFHIGEKVLGCAAGMCASAVSLELDVNVRNDAFQKEIGIIWTTDHWATQFTSFAQFKKSLVGNHEVWSASIGVGVSDPNHPAPADVEFAVYAKMNGRTSWDPFNDYHTAAAVTESQPVRAAKWSTCVPAGGTKATLNGQARVLNSAFAKEVTVRISDDGWMTFRDVQAAFTADNLWQFQVTNLNPGPLSPEQIAAGTCGEAGRLQNAGVGIQFAIRYKVAGQTFWDNNRGLNYSTRFTIPAE